MQEEKHNRNLSIRLKTKRIFSSKTQIFAERNLHTNKIFLSLFKLEDGKKMCFVKQATSLDREEDTKSFIPAHQAEELGFKQGFLTKTEDTQNLCSLSFTEENCTKWN